MRPSAARKKQSRMQRGWRFCSCRRPKPGARRQGPRDMKGPTCAQRAAGWPAVLIRARLSCAHKALPVTLRLPMDITIETLLERLACTFGLNGCSAYADLRHGCFRELAQSCLAMAAAQRFRLRMRVPVRAASAYFETFQSMSLLPCLLLLIPCPCARKATVVEMHHSCEMIW